MAAPCPTCFPIECDPGNDAGLYSLEGAVFPYVLNCPPGFNCNNPSNFYMVCCNQIVSVSIPPGASVAQQLALIGSVVSECASILPFCGQAPPPGTPGNPPPTVQIYLNVAQTCTLACPDGTIFSYTVPAGVFGVAATGTLTAAQAQNQVNQEASAFACQQAGLRRVCLGPLPCAACQNAAYDAFITATGGAGPFTWVITSGTLPTGLTLDPFTGEINGTPTVAGAFPFGLTVTEASGGTVTKNYTLNVIGITSTSLPPFVIGSPYSYQLTATGGPSRNYNYKITSGTLPAGLNRSLTG